MISFRTAIKSTFLFMKFLNKINIITLFLLSVINLTYAQNFERISNKEGFNQNTINVIGQDLYGFLWYGTPNGLIRYDGYEFKTYTTQSKGDGNIASNFITSFYNDENGVLWIGTSLGLNVYIPWLERFYSVPLPRKFSINHIAAAPNGSIWFSGGNELHTCELEDVDNGIFKVSENILGSKIKNLEILNFSFKDENTLIVAAVNGLKKIAIVKNSLKRTPKIESIMDFESFKGKSITAILNLNDLFWIGTKKGVFKVTIDGDTAHILNDFSTSNNLKSLSSKLSVNTIFQDHSGIIWVGTTNEGLYKYDQEQDLLEHFDNDPKNKLGLSSNFIKALYQDDFNVLWIGTAQGGINKLDLSQKPFINYTNNPFDPDSILDNLITTIFEDKKGRLWVSGYNESLIRSINVVNEETISKLKFEDLKNKIPLDVQGTIRCIYEDKHGFLWFGGDDTLMVYNPKTNQFKKLVLRNEGTPIKIQSIRDIIQIDENNILLAGNLIAVLSNPWKKIEDENSADIDASSFINMGYQRVHNVLVDGASSLWFATSKGLAHGSFNVNQIVINKTYTNDEAEDIRLSNIEVFSLYKEHNNIWIGTFGGGLNKMTLDSHGNPLSIEYFRKNDVLPDDAIYGILQDGEDHLWLSTDMGLAKFNTSNNGVNVYDVRDGLPQNNFRQNAYFKGRSGYFYFGGLNGLTVFDPQKIKENTQAPEILISALFIDNQLVNIGEEIDGNVLLEKSISETDNLAISKKERIISFNLAVKHTSVPSKNKLAYKLEGFNEDWIELDEGKATVTYTNLSAGKYIFRVKAANGDAIWSVSDRTLNIEILPRWYNTWWSYLFFFILAIALGIGIVIYFVQLERLKQGLIYEKKDKERLETINQGKFRYFTNLSHEFRTPLTLIAGPLERIIANNTDSRNTKYLSIVQKNTKRLLSLADQLITFRQAEQGHVKLNLTRLTLGDFIYPTTEAFENYALERNVNFFYKVNDPNENIVIDIEKFERILFNLLSNSFKNTPPQGTISIEAGIVRSSDKNWIKIHVIDNGKGIPPESLDNIFERFYQLGNEEGDVSGGGIGLSFCKSLVGLFEGEIYATSTPGVETRFTVKIPSIYEEMCEIDNVQGAEKSFIQDWIPLSNTINEDDDNTLKQGNQKEFSILVVENEVDVQSFLYQELSPNYNVTIANNGIEALDKIKIKEPDLIVSDVMMPEMDGYQLCEKIKSTPEMCHIPVLLLTALGADEDIIKGLEFGAEEYLSKPFSIKHLELRIVRLIQNSKKIRQYFSKNSALPKADIKLELSKKDEVFLENIVQAIEKNLSDSTFGVEELSAEIGLSTSHFYRRLKQLTGQVPNVYLRNFRLQRAAELLQNNEGFNVAEVMYQIGIESNSYFSTSFKKLHGSSPSEFLKKNMP
ncbi:two-component regulator propeller domain-containing protein [Formosa sp. PL04]|uniref:hybrid sensor histidine kinase/response regulator transcription factor n=1 Tax=Formosa sp. PL04 TaxID=3081755 RepID=UPI002982B3E5|nr:two-component regulator propeller domain-containing protein [Formosa sp. PL04]MDW5289688.1 two-component regulator propeller domain-containing protein [Formosa sp. PL04]